MSQASVVKSAAEKIESASIDKQLLVGFDGFVDVIMHVVDTRHDAENYEAIPTIAEYGKRVSAAAGLSTNFEMVPQKIKLGGNGPIMANALAAHEYAVHYVGALGKEVVNPVFNQLERNCASVVSLCDPGHTDALEFEDGKIMMGTSSELLHVNWENLLEQLPEAKLVALLNQVSLLAFNNWTMLPNLNSIIHGISKLLAGLDHDLKVFIDLTDPEKRTKKELLEVTRLISLMEEHADVTFGMNEKESRAVASVVLGEACATLEERATQLREKLNISQVLIHPTHSACVASAEGFFYVDGPFTPKPKLTTGAGDNFNAGFCVGLLSGLHPHECLASGVSTSGFYVRNARSAERKELVDFMRKWVEVNCGPLS
jgi:sugar/nucleoside kinase (ribokinase family)